jgi:hypothetical protein
MPCVTDNIHEARHGDPNILKFEGAGPPRATVIRKEERTMIG